MKSEVYQLWRLFLHLGSGEAKFFVRMTFQALEQQRTKKMVILGHFEAYFGFLIPKAGSKIKVFADFLNQIHALIL